MREHRADAHQPVGKATPIGRSPISISRSPRRAAAPNDALPVDPNWNGRLALPQLSERQGEVTVSKGRRNRMGCRAGA
jgi:hypothetical protein